MKDEYSQAIKDYTAAIAINPKYFLAYRNRGITYLNQGDKAKGCADLTKACDLDYCKNDVIVVYEGDIPTRRCDTWSKLLCLIKNIIKKL